MVEFIEYLLNCAKLYSNPYNRDEAFTQINQKVLWFQPFFFLLLLIIWKTLLNNKTISIPLMIYTIIKFSIASFLSIYIYHQVMVILGGIGKLIDSLRIGLSILIFPSLLHILFSITNSLLGNKYVSLILGISSILLVLWTIIISIIVYSKIHTLSIEYATIAICGSIFILSGITFLLKLTY